jgi:hypothetical protein
MVNGRRSMSDKPVKSKLEYTADMDEFSTEGVHKDNLVKDTMTAMTVEDQQDKLITFEKWFPLLQRFGNPDDMTVEEMVNRATPLAVGKMVELMMSAKSEKIQASCAKEIAYMGGMKPVEKTQSVNVNVMARAEAASLLESKLEKFGIQVIDAEVVDAEEDCETEEGNVREDTESFNTEKKEQDS